MEHKRIISILIPYKIRDKKLLVYLQKRSKHAKRSPNYFGFFGGGRERDENPEEALRRELKEEIDFVPESCRYFRRFEFQVGIKDIFVVEVDDNFESQITILEGDYGKWFNEQEALEEPKMIEEDKIVLQAFRESLRARL